MTKNFKTGFINKCAETGFTQQQAEQEFDKYVNTLPESVGHVAMLFDGHTPSGAGYMLNGARKSYPVQEFTQSLTPYEMKKMQLAGLFNADAKQYTPLGTSVVNRAISQWTRSPVASMTPDAWKLLDFANGKTDGEPSYSDFENVVGNPQQFDYSKAEIDTSVGNNGYSSDVPTFAFYKGEPAELRRKRFNEALKNYAAEIQEKSDALLKK